MVKYYRSTELIYSIFLHYSCLVFRSDCDTLQHVADAVSQSSKGNEAVIIQNDSVKYREWKEFIQTAFLPLKGIRKFHHFYFSALLPGIVLCSVDADSEKVPVVLRKEDICADLPSEILPGGLSRERQIYLYKNIRPHVREQFRNITCPEFNEEYKKILTA